MQDNNKLIEEILSLDAFSGVFSLLKSADPDVAMNFKSALINRLKPYHEIIVKSKIPTTEKIIAVFNARLELLDFAKPYYKFAEENAKQRVYFMRIAYDSANIFFDYVYDEIQLYFDKKYKLITLHLTQDASMWTGIQDSLRKTGGKLINVSTKTMCDITQHIIGQVQENGSENIQNDNSAYIIENVIDERSLIEKKLEELCSPDIILQDLGDVFQKASDIYKDEWNKRIACYYDTLQFHDRQINRIIPLMTNQPEFTLGIAEQIFATAFGATLVGTFSLAVGWHTLAYSMMNVFPPLALFAALTTLAVAYWKKEDELNKMVDQTEKILKTYHAQLIVFIDSGSIEQYGGKSIRQLVFTQSMKLAEELHSEWLKAQFGSITEVHCNAIQEATDQHIRNLIKLEIALKIQK